MTWAVLEVVKGMFMWVSIIVISLWIFPYLPSMWSAAVKGIVAIANQESISYFGNEMLCCHWAIAHCTLMAIKEIFRSLVRLIQLFRLHPPANFLVVIVANLLCSNHLALAGFEVFKLDCRECSDDLVAAATRAQLGRRFQCTSLPWSWKWFALKCIDTTHNTHWNSFHCLGEI